MSITSQSIDFLDMPTIQVAAGKKNRNEYDVAAIVSWLESKRNGALTITAVIERQQAMPGQGVSSMFRIGEGYGLLRGVLAALKIPYEIVAPVSWKRALMPDAPKDKGASILAAKRLFPLVAGDLSRKKDHGRSDALLLAEYARRRQLSLASR